MFDNQVITEKFRFFHFTDSKMGDLCCIFARVMKKDTIHRDYYIIEGDNESCKRVSRKVDQVQRFLGARYEEGMRPTKVSLRNY